MKKQLVSILLSRPEGRIIAYNALSSLNNRLISSDLLRQFFSHCMEAFQEDNVDEIDHLISQFEDVARGARPANVSKGAFLLACKRTTASITKDAIMYNVIEYGTLRSFILKDSVAAAGHSFVSCNPDPTDLTIEESIEQINNIPDKYQSGASLGGNFKRPFFWITPSLERNQLVKNFEKYADYIRDRLGLIHYKINHTLIGIEIPGEVISQHKNSRPTFMDAISHRRFRVLPDTKKARKRTGWGYTVDLAKFADQKDKIDGLPERVVEPIDCKAELGLKFKYIGKITINRGDSNRDDDEAFAGRLNNSSGINDNELRQEILKFF